MVMVSNFFTFMVSNLRRAAEIPACFYLSVLLRKTVFVTKEMTVILVYY
jgi:uncharacterized membrane protein